MNQESIPQKLSPEAFAVIAAALHTVIREPHRIVSIYDMTPMTEAANLNLMSWSIEGRRQIFSSHRTR